MWCFFSQSQNLSSKVFDEVKAGERFFGGGCQLQSNKRETWILSRFLEEMVQQAQNSTSDIICLSKMRFCKVSAMILTVMPDPPGPSFSNEWIHVPLQWPLKGLWLKGKEEGVCIKFISTYNHTSCYPQVFVYFLCVYCFFKRGKHSFTLLSGVSCHGIGRLLNETHCYIWTDFSEFEHG